MPAPNTRTTVDRFASPATRRRFAPSILDADGLPVRGQPVDSAITIHTWPAPGEVISMLPEGHRQSNVRMGHTTDELLAADTLVDGTRQPSDHVITLGREWMVSSVAIWTGYREVVLVEVRRQTAPFGVTATLEGATLQSELA